MRSLALYVCLVVTGCMGDNAAPSSASDQPLESACSGQLYDPCTSDDQCTAHLCKLYSTREVQVCTTTCSASEPCPSQNGTAVTCNNMGLCRPDAPNTCEASP